MEAKQHNSEQPLGERENCKETKHFKTNQQKSKYNISNHMGFHNSSSESL